MSTHQNVLVSVASLGKNDEVQILLSCGANPSSPDCDGILPLVAVQYGHKSIGRRLLETGAKGDCHDKVAAPSRHWIRNGHLSRTEALVQLLLVVGADANLATNVDISAILVPLDSNEQYQHFVNGHNKVVKRLLGAGANPNQISSIGRARDVAVQQGHIHVVHAVDEALAQSHLQSGTDLAQSLLQAAATGDVFQVADLLQQGVDPTSVNKARPPPSKRSRLKGL
ncbi:Aste57867_21359 [Aphanomyces stellatus]|uniref:Aste57867_21359 protein n=1 Tax=Aphanomyces stellatus TaxID=120398 RepID=A0A485LLW2_9STRA|nr:hypothetical protein As57867_021290 [Aphanomyces stellatus]VFT98031.1 Aste57867_21359 [Aphanomyces stellatus]